MAQESVPPIYAWLAPIEGLKVSRRSRKKCFLRKLMALC